MTTPPNPYYGSPNSPAPTGHRGGARRSPKLITAAVLGMLGTACAVTSMFLNYVSFTDARRGEIQFEQNLTPWAFEFHTSDSDVSPGLAQAIPPLYGVILTLLALGLLLTAALTIRASAAAADSGRVRAARATALATASAALCLSLMLLLDVISFLSFEYNEPDSTSTENYSIAAGFWLIMGVGLFAVAAAISAALPARRPPAAPWQQVQQHPGQASPQQHQQPYQQAYPQQQYPYPQQAGQPQQGNPGYY